jgi:hypothetical protein
MDANQTVWIASGVTTYYAEDAANVLASGNLGDKGFWYRTRKCADVDGDGTPKTMLDVGAIIFETIHTSEWAADVDGDGTPKTMLDVGAIIFENLNCCGEC